MVETDGRILTISKVSRVNVEASLVTSIVVAPGEDPSLFRGFALRRLSGREMRQKDEAKKKETQQQKRRAGRSCMLHNK